ncbi:muconolactone Delta-isomerase family protein [Halomonas halocynthiae]|uniref:muconolactone Delta-isomerase family protein n=1 Tax=Halomonas halocynthiae TaxID=176290 RepID=UPI000A00B98B|nr:muconolactone Delta-isomerase family protein [Halomonas halocynthiae]
MRRVASSYANVSVFDVKDNAELQKLVLNLPLFPYMTIRVKPLYRHPTAIREDDS